jgi:hypothetical protein
MTSTATGLDAGATQWRALRHWLAPGVSLIWRFPLLVALALLSLLYAFRGLVHLAFLFEAHPIGTFLFAPALLPFAAFPAICFLLVIRVLPGVWRDRSLSPGRKSLAVAGGPLAAHLAAWVLDLVQINMIKLMGIALPRLPLDPY